MDYTIEAFNSSGGCWVIYRHKYGHKGIQGLYKTYDEAMSQLNSLRYTVI